MAKAEYRSAIRSRRLIQKALANLLQEKPLDKITVTDVVRLAGINRGTFYAHYKDIPDVIQHVIEETFSNIREVFSESSVSLNSLPHVMLRRVQETMEADMDFCRKVMASSASAMMEEQLVNLMLDYLLQNGDKMGWGNRENYEFTMRFCAGGISNLYREWFMGKIPISLEELTKQTEELLNRMVVSRRKKV